MCVSVCVCVCVHVSWHTHELHPLLTHTGSWFCQLWLRAVSVQRDQGDWLSMPLAICTQWLYPLITGVEEHCNIFCGTERVSVRASDGRPVQLCGDMLTSPTLGVQTQTNTHDMHAQYWCHWYAEINNCIIQYLYCTIYSWWTDTHTHTLLNCIWLQHMYRGIKILVCKDSHTLRLHPTQGHTHVQPLVWMDKI